MNTATAVLISGQTRTFKHCFKTQKWGLFRKLVNPHFFVSVADDKQAADVEVLRDHFPVVHIERVVQPTLDVDTATRFTEAARHAPYGIAATAQGIYAQLWALARVWEFFEAKNDPAFNYQYYLRIRPDLHIHYFTPPRTMMLNLRDNHVYVPHWGSWGGIPDRCAFIQGHLAAGHYFNAFHRIEELLAIGCPFHPETLLAAALERAAVPVHQTLDAEFTTIRLPGDKRPHDAPSYNMRDMMGFVRTVFQEAGL